MARIQSLIRLAGSLLAAVMLGGAAHAQFSAPSSGGFTAPAQTVDAGYAVVSLVTESGSVRVGEPVRAALQLKIDDGWHVYWINAGDSGLPARLSWTDAEMVTNSALEWPSPHEQPLDGLMNYGYEDELILPFDLTVLSASGDTVTLGANVSYLICEDICIPEEADLELTLTIGPDAAPDPDAQEIIARGEASLPVAITGTARIDRSAATWVLSVADPALAGVRDAVNVRFFPLDHQIEHPPVQPLKVGPAGVSLELTPAAGFETEGTIAGVIVAEYGDGRRDGFALTAEPGSVIDGTADETVILSSLSGGSGGGATSTGTGGGSQEAGLLNLGSALLLALVGGLILNLMPCVLPVLSMKAIGLARAASEGDSGHLRLHGLAYFGGVVVSMLALAAVLIAIKSAGNAAGIGTQLQSPPLVAVFAIIIFLIGLNLYGLFEIGGSLIGVGDDLARKPGVGGAFFTGVLAAVLGAPCIGPFLGAASGWALSQSAPVILLFFLVMGAGLALPFTLISFAPGLQRLLPRPGAWMERLKQAFAFPMFLTAIWLVWVLAMGEGGANAAAATLTAATLIVFAIFLFKSVPDRSGALRFIGLGVGAVALVSGAALALTGTLPRSSDLTVVEWSAEEVATARAAGSPIFVDFTAAWCVTCQVNKQTTLRNTRVIRTFNEAGVVFMEADWTDQNDVIAEELQRFGRAGVPLYLYYPAGGAEPQILNQVLSPNYVIDLVKGS